MLQGDVGQGDGGVRLEDVGRVPAPAEARLHRHRGHARPPRKAQNAIAVRASNWVTGSPSASAGPPAAVAHRAAASAKAASPIGSPSTWTRSVQSTTWGDRYAPARRPLAVSAAAARRAVERLAVGAHHVQRRGAPAPGRRARRAARRMRSSPRRIPRISSPAIQSRASAGRHPERGDARGERLALGGVAGRLLALGLDQVRGRPLDEALRRPACARARRELALGLGELALQALAPPPGRPSSARGPTLMERPPGRRTCDQGRPRRRRGATTGRGRATPWAGAGPSPAGARRGRSPAGAVGAQGGHHLLHAGPSRPRPPRRPRPGRPAGRAPPGAPRRRAGATSTPRSRTA